MKRQTALINIETLKIEKSIKMNEKAFVIENALARHYGIPELLQGDLLKGRTPASVNRIIATVKHSLRKAYEWELIGEETLKRVQRVKPLKGEIQRLRFLSIEECQKLIDADGLE